MKSIHDNRPKTLKQEVLSLQRQTRKIAQIRRELEAELNREPKGHNA